MDSVMEYPLDLQFPDNKTWNKENYGANLGEESSTTETHQSTETMHHTDNNKHQINSGSQQQHEQWQQSSGSSQYLVPQIRMTESEELRHSPTDSESEKYSEEHHVERTCEIPAQNWEHYAVHEQSLSRSVTPELSRSSTPEDENPFTKRLPEMPKNTYNRRIKSGSSIDDDTLGYLKFEEALKFMTDRGRDGVPFDVTQLSRDANISKDQLYNVAVYLKHFGMARSETRGFLQFDEKFSYQDMVKSRTLNRQVDTLKNEEAELDEALESIQSIWRRTVSNPYTFVRPEDVELGENSTLLAKTSGVETTLTESMALLTNAQNVVKIDGPELKSGYLPQKALTHFAPAKWTNAGTSIDKAYGFEPPPPPVEDPNNRVAQPAALTEHDLLVLREWFSTAQKKYTLTDGRSIAQLFLECGTYPGLIDSLTYEPPGSSTEYHDKDVHIDNASFLKVLSAMEREAAAKAAIEEEKKNLKNKKERERRAMARAKRAEAGLLPKRRPNYKNNQPAKKIKLEDQLKNLDPSNAPMSTFDTNFKPTQWVNTGETHSANGHCDMEVVGGNQPQLECPNLKMEVVPDDGYGHANDHEFYSNREQFEPTWQMNGNSDFADYQAFQGQEDPFIVQQQAQDHQEFDYGQGQDNPYTAQNQAEDYQEFDNDQHPVHASDGSYGEHPANSAYDYRNIDEDDEIDLGFLEPGLKI